MLRTFNLRRTGALLAITPIIGAIFVRMRAAVAKDFQADLPWRGLAIFLASASEFTPRMDKRGYSLSGLKIS